MTNELVQHDIVRLAKRNLASDIFRKVNSNNEHTYCDSEALRRKIHHRYQKAAAKVTLKRIKTILDLHLAKKELFFELILMRISIHKKMLLLDIDGDKHVYLQGDLDTSQFSHSFRYYDFIMNFIEENFPNKRRDYFKMQRQVAHQIHQKSFKSKIVNRIGLFDNQDDFLVYNAQQISASDQESKKQLELDKMKL